MTQIDNQQAEQAETSESDDSPKKPKILVRNINPEVFEYLRRSAQEHDRSIEAEARIAIERHILPYRIRAERHTRRTALAERLDLAFNTFLENNPEHSRKLSYLAQVIGEDRAGPLEDWFRGGSEPTFKQIESLAAYLGCSKRWLTFGEGSMTDAITEGV